MSFRFGITAVALGLLLAPIAGLAEHPFDGHWVLDLKKSKNVGVASSEQTVTVSDGQVDVSAKWRQAFREAQTLEYTLVTNGELHEVKGANDNHRNARVEWNGRSLEVRFEFDVQDGTVHIEAEEIWKLKRKNLVIQTTFTSPQGEYELKYVFVRAE